MNKDVEKIYDFVKQQEDFCDNEAEPKTESDGNVSFSITAATRAMAFKKIRYFIEEMEAQDDQ